MGIEFPTPEKTLIIKFPPPRDGKGVKCPGYARGGHVEASIWPIHKSQDTLLCDLEIARCLTLQFINRKCAIYKSQLCVLCISNVRFIKRRCALECLISRRAGASQGCWRGAGTCNGITGALQIEYNHNTSIKFPGGTPGNSCWECAALLSKSWPYLRPKNVIFTPVFRPGLQEMMSSLLRLEHQQKVTKAIS